MQPRPNIYDHEERIATLERILLPTTPDDPNNPIQNLHRLTLSIKDEMASQESVNKLREDMATKLDIARLEKKLDAILAKVKP